MADSTGIVASSEFDPTPYVTGIDKMIASVDEFAKKEKILQAALSSMDTALANNRKELKATQEQIAALDKTSVTYKNDLAALTKQQDTLKAQQKDLQTTIKATKTELDGTSKTVAEYQKNLQQFIITAKKAGESGKAFSLFDVKTLNEQVGQLSKLGPKLEQLFKGKVDDKELTALEQRLGEATDEFKQLGEVIDFIKQKLSTLDANSEEFAELSKIVETGEQVLSAFAETQERVAESGKTVRQRLNELRVEMQRLVDAGQEDSEAFRQMAIEAAELQDAVDKTAERIRVMADSGRFFKAGVEGLRALAAGFELAAGFSALFGEKNEEAEKIVQRLVAIMSIVNGLQEVSNLLKKQSVLLVVGEEVALKAATVAQRLYAFAVGTSTGAMRAFRVALLATGIGAIIVALGLAAEAMGVFGGSAEDAATDVEALNDAIERNIELLEIGVKAAKTAAAIQEERARQQITNEAQLAGKLSQIRLNSLSFERDKIQKEIIAIRKTQDDFLNKGLASQDFIDKSNAQVKRLFSRLQDINSEIEIENEKSITRQIENQRKAYLAYLDRLVELQRRLRDVQLQGLPQDEQAVRQALTNTFNDALDDLDKDVRDGKLTRGRADILGKLLEQIFAAETDQQVSEFRRRAEEAVRTFEESLTDLQDRSAKERTELLRDEMTRRAEVISQSMQQEERQLIREREALLRDIAQSQREGLISPDVAEENAQQVMAIFEQLLANLADRTSQQLEALTGEVFKRQMEEVERLFTLLDVSLSESTTQEIVVLSQRFAAGKISYDKYQKELTEITRRESEKRINQQLKEAEALLAAQQQRIREVERANALRVAAGSDIDTTELNKLRDEEAALRGQIAGLKRQLAEAGAEGIHKDQEDVKARIAIVAQYAQAIGNVVSQVVAFWQAANQAEQAALDRSIALQERRVEAAVRVAERGNAEYLRLEEDRLREIQVKQENAARRQLAVNAVLQTSQALTAFVTALSQGISIGGPLGGIAIATAVLGLLASGYAIIQNLQQNNAQRLYEGTKEVRSDKHPDGVDTVPAMLTKGEAVVAAGTNKKYKPALAAIIDETIPPEVLNRFVMNYRVPEPNYARIGEAAESSIGYGAQLLFVGQQQNNLLKEQNDNLVAVHKQLKNIGIVFNVDRNGLVLGVMDGVAQETISRKA